MYIFHFLYINYRVQQTIFKTIARYMKANKTSRFIDVLPQIVKNYNNTFHSAIGMPPSRVNKNNLEEVAFNLYYAESDPRNAKMSVKAKYDVGQHVMVSRLKKGFKKGYASNFMDEIFKISDVHMTIPVQYTLADLCEKESTLSGKFYEDEIAPVKLPSILDIKEIVGVEKRRGRDFFKVKFLNMPECEPTLVTLEYLKKGATKDILKEYGIQT